MTFSPARYWEDRLNANFDERGVGDIGMSRSYNAFLYKVRGKVFRRIVASLPLVSSNSRVVDIGSGTGFYIAEWLRWGAGRIAGLDITETSVERLRKAFPPCEFELGDIGDPNFRTQFPAADVVSAFDVLFHIVDDDRYVQAITNISRMVKPGGWFLYSDNLVRDVARTSHYISRPESLILEVVAAAGFDVVKRVPMFVLMNDPVRSESRLARKWFSLVYRTARRGEPWGKILGTALYPLEIAATRLSTGNPSTEVLICRRARNANDK